MHEKAPSVLAGVATSGGSFPVCRKAPLLTGSNYSDFCFQRRTQGGQNVDGGIYGQVSNVDLVNEDNLQVIILKSSRLSSLGDCLWIIGTKGRLVLVVRNQTQGFLSNFYSFLRQFSQVVSVLFWNASENGLLSLVLSVQRWRTIRRWWRVWRRRSGWFRTNLRFILSSHGPVDQVQTFPSLKDQNFQSVFHFSLIASLYLQRNETGNRPLRQFDNWLCVQWPHVPPAVRNKIFGISSIQDFYSIVDLAIMTHGWTFLSGISPGHYRESTGTVTHSTPELWKPKPSDP